MADEQTDKQNHARKDTSADQRTDLQTINLFVILAVLTCLAVLGLRLVLFVPTTNEQLSARPHILPVLSEAAGK